MPAQVPTVEEFSNFGKMTSEALDQVNLEITKLKDRIGKLETSNVYDDFKYTYDFKNGNKSPNGKWNREYDSAGFIRVENGSLVMQPGGSTLTNKGGSAKVNSTKSFGNFRATFYVTTEQQVYADKEGWMAAFPIFRFVDKFRHWYIIVGINELEIGKKDAPTNLTDQNEIEKYQYTLSTKGIGTPLKQKRKVTIEFIGNVLKVWLDDKLQDTLVDDGSLINQRKEKVKQSDWTTGLFCPYVEGSRARYEPITIEVL